MSLAHALEKTFPALATALSAEDLRAFSNALEPRVLGEGDVLVREGEPSAELHLLVAGKLRVQLRTESGSIEVAALSPGTLAAEIGFIDGGPASATVEAGERAEVLVLSAPAFQELARSHPDVATTLLVNVCTAIAARIREASDRFDDLAPGEAVAEGPPGLLRRLSLLFGFLRS